MLLGCSHIQGYFMSKPVEETAVTRVIETIAARDPALVLADVGVGDV